MIYTRMVTLKYMITSKLYSFIQIRSLCNPIASGTVDTYLNWVSIFTMSDIITLEFVKNLLKEDYPDVVIDSFEVRVFKNCCQTFNSNHIMIAESSIILKLFQPFEYDTSAIYSPLNNTIKFTRVTQARNEVTIIRRWYIE